MTTTGKSCKALTKSGKPCAGHVMPGSDYCLFHDPARAAERAKARSNGGKARHGRKLGSIPQIVPTAEVKPIKVESISDVLALVVRAINDTLLLENSVNRNRALGTLAVAAVDCLRESELEQRIAALEQRLRDKRIA